MENPPKHKAAVMDFPVGAAFFQINSWVRIMVGMGRRERYKNEREKK